MAGRNRPFLLTDPRLSSVARPTRIADISSHSSKLLMSAFFASSSHMPCTECGASLRTAVSEEHVCDPERRLDYRMFQLREEVAGFEESLRGFLESAHGRFAQWLAERERRTA
jgi:hypothetical protein